MNDFQMHSLTSDRSRQLMAEADQHRLAAQARQPKADSKPSAARTGFRIGFAFLTRRSAA